MAARVADFCQTVDHFDACILDEKELEDEGIIFRPSKPVTISCPSEDLWKKFALPPTPPRSPVRSVVEITQHEKIVAERLQILSETLDNDVYDNCSYLDAITWKTKIIQDCMWNGSGVDEPRRDSVSSEDVDMYPTPCSTPPPLDYSCTECVDPATVFPSCSFNDSCSCSSFSDSDEEIDVVTVDKPVTVGLKRKLSAIETKSSRVTSKPSPLKRARSHPGHVTDAGFHDYTSLMSPITIKAPTMVTLKSSTRNSNNVTQPPPTLSRRERIRYDDMDPESKRATHNVLERKRRNDLKSSFQSLRSAVPTLKSSEKTPKVIILRKAADHIRHLKTDGERLVKEKESLRKKQQEMLKKYVTLTKGKISATAKSA